MLRIGRTHFENFRNYLATNGIIPRVHGNVKKVSRCKTKITIDITVATAVKDFIENYAEIHGLPSPDRNANRIIQPLTFLPVTSRSIVMLLQTTDNTLKLLKYYAFRMLGIN